MSNIFEGFKLVFIKGPFLNQVHLGFEPVERRNKNLVNLISSYELK